MIDISCPYLVKMVLEKCIIIYAFILALNRFFIRNNEQKMVI